MKTVLRIFAFLFVASCNNAVDAQTIADQKKPDPIVGNWRWGTFKFTVDIRADGSFLCSDSGLGAGVWKIIPGENVERKYQLTWRNGAIVDLLTLSRDGKKLFGKNSNGEKFSSQRVE